MCGVVQFMWIFYYKTANCTTSCGAVHFTCGTVRLCHFVGSFGAIFAV